VIASCSPENHFSRTPPAEFAKLSDDEQCLIAVQAYLYELFRKEQSLSEADLSSSLDPSQFTYSVKRSNEENLYRLTPNRSKKLKVFHGMHTKWPGEVRVNRRTHKVIDIGIAG
jgi:hypothetical protein